MLNKDGARELAYVIKIDAIEPIVGSDNCEAAVVGGWRIMTRKNTFQPGDLAVYFEIDSQVPATEQFAFLEKKHYKVKTQKYTFGGKGNFISQGLLMSAADFGWRIVENGTAMAKPNGDYFELGDFLTKELNVVYAEADDNKRKAPSADKYKKMAQRRPNLFKKNWVRWLMRREWGKKLLFFFFGKAKDKKGGWPSWVVKTDEERIQNMPWIPADKTPWIATEKIDGTSTTFTMKGWGRKREFYICSRNVVFDTPDKNCYYDTNVYTEMAEKYDIKRVLEELMVYFSSLQLEKKEVEFVTLQGETFGAKVQKRDYSRKDHDFRAFNLIIGWHDGRTTRLNPQEMTDVLKNYGIPCVPIVAEHVILPDTIDEILEMAAGVSAEDGLEREGLVFRSYDGSKSFKAVSNEFLLKYHG